MKLAVYHAEACDNAKFLGAIEKSSHGIYLEGPATMKVLINHLKFKYIKFTMDS